MAKAKKDGAKPSLRDKMAAAFKQMQSERLAAIDREPAKNVCPKA